MANLTELDQWDDTVYELATTDPVMGGPGGIDNAQPQTLANRTRFLYERTKRERQTMKLVGPAGGIGNGHFPLNLAANDCLLNLRANETAELGGDINLPSAALCVGKRYFMFITNGGLGCVLKPNGTDGFLNGVSTACPAGTAYTLLSATDDDVQFSWFTPDGANWLVSYIRGSDPLA